MAEFCFAGPDTYECSDYEIFEACLRVRHRYSVRFNNLIFSAFKSGVPTKEIHVRVIEPPTLKKSDILRIDRLLNMDMLRHCRNIEELFEEVFIDMVNRICEERKKRDMDFVNNIATSMSTGTYYPYKSASEVALEKIQKIVEEYLSEINETHKDMGEFYCKYREGEKHPHMLYCRAKDFKGARFGSSFDADANNKAYTLCEMDEAVEQIKHHINECHSRNASSRSSYQEVIFNPPATIVLWSDGSKTVVKCGKNEKFDPEKGLAMCIAKKVLGNKGNYYELFKEWLPKRETVDLHKDNTITFVTTPCTVNPEDIDIPENPDFIIEVEACLEKAFKTFKGEIERKAADEQRATQES